MPASESLLTQGSPVWSVIINFQLTLVTLQIYVFCADYYL
jgi:hypothetical protein